MPNKSSLTVSFLSFLLLCNNRATLAQRPEDWFITPQRLGLPAGNTRSSQPNERVYQLDDKGTPKLPQPPAYPFTPKPGYELKPNESLRKHNGVDITTRLNGKPAEMDFKSGVYGVVTRAGGGDYNTITVKLNDGTQIQYLHSSKVYVKVGDRVTPDTVIAKSGKVGAGAIHIHVQARDKSGKIVDSPDAAFSKGAAASNSKGISTDSGNRSAGTSTRGDLGGVLINPKAIRESGRPATPAAGSSASTWLAVSMRATLNDDDLSIGANISGATRWHGFWLTADDQGADCILLLEKEPGRPPLRWDDLAVAFRNVRAGESRPACTIDPRAETLKQLAEIGRIISGEGDEQAVEQSLQQWERVGRGPQDVRVFEVDSESHFASVMVQADYALKSICNGATQIAGLASLTDRVANQAQSAIATGSGHATTLDSQNRFWFNSGRVSYRTDGRLYVLKECQVKLLTEEEAITYEGQRRGLARGEPMATAFAEDLTKQFQVLARNNGVFRELENLYRTVALMALIAAEGLEVSGLLEAFFAKTAVEKVRFDKTLPGRVMIKRIEGTLAGGTYRLVMPSCGGVSVDIHANSMTRESFSPELARAIAARIMDNRPGPLARDWEVRVSKR